MKKLIFLLIAVIALSNCSAQTTNNKLNIKKREKITNNRKFDIEEYRKVIKKNPFADRMLRTDKNGMVIEMNTCLLYTSPSPRDSTSSRMPSSA